MILILFSINSRITVRNVEINDRVTTSNFEFHGEKFHMKEACEKCEKFHMKEAFEFHINNRIVIPDLI